MTDSFRMGVVTQRDSDLPDRRVRIGEQFADAANHLTAITGKNGVGKSRLLSHIAAVFEAVGGAKPRPGIEATVEYEVGRLRCKATLDRGKIFAELDGVSIDPSRLPGPKRVAAVTTSAFDKFPIPRSALDRSSPQPPSTYRYLGLKDSRGRISVTAGLYRALDELFDSIAADEHHRSRISEVFRDLGYEARVEVVYDWTRLGGGLVKAGADLGQAEYSAFSRLPSEVSGSWIDRESPDVREHMVRELARAVELIGELGTTREGALVADFRSPTVARLDHLRAAQVLRRADMIRTKSVVLIRLGSGRRVDVKDASSGELSLVTAMLGIASAIDNNSLILIDEPEISLHPEWQSSYIDRLLSAFEGFEGCHFLVATHSPLIVSGLPEVNSNVVSLEHEIGADYVAGRSVDEVMVRAFGMAGPENLYVKQSLVRALRMAADGRFNDPEFTALTDVLKASSTAKGLAPGVLRVIEDLEATVARARQASR